MSASEFAFLALGFFFGIATGVAVVFVIRTASPAREVKLTVSHDAVPKRASTLATDAFVTAPAEPARGGPADRRMHDRPLADAPFDVSTPAPATALTAAVGAPVMRTPVPSGGALAPALAQAAAARVAQTAWSSAPGPVLTPARTPASAVVSAAASPAASAPAAVSVAVATPPLPDLPLDMAADLAEEDEEVAFVRMLHGDHRTMLAAIDRLAGADGEARRAWQIALTGLVEATLARTIDLGVLEFPLGNAFWDSFTIDQCREIAGALASMGYRFDGTGGWDGDLAPGYRELTIAVADAGLDPRRIRAWPNTMEIEMLLRGARPAPEELLADRARDLDADSLRELLGSRADAIEMIWQAWSDVRPLLVSTAAPG